MKKIIKKILNILLNKISGKRNFQNFFQVMYNISLKGMNYGNNGNFEDSGELNVLFFLNKRFRDEKKLLFFDIGANHGYYAKALSENSNNDLVIHSFEPSRYTFEIFLENTKSIKNIISNNFGFSDIENNQLLYTNKEGSGLASIYQRKLDHFGISMDKNEEIKLTTIDTYCNENSINRIHFLKLDIEGHELKALMGAKEMIKNKKIDIIQFEFGGCNIDSRTYFQDFYYLLKDNYKIHRILKDGFVEMNNYNEIFEIFININYIAIIK